MSRAVLAIDQGTTGSTAWVVSQEGEMLGSAYAELHQHYPQPGWVEHDAEEIWETSLRVMVAALVDARVAGDEIAAIGITNQRETTVVWDRHSGRPLHRAIVWQSRQTAPICERLVADGHQGWIGDRTGLVIDAYFSASKVQWILDRYDEGRAKGEAGDLLCGTIDTWLLWKLSGGAVHATEPTNASRTMLFDIHRRCWDEELAALFRVPMAMLPEVKPSSGVFATTVSHGPLPSGIPVAGMVGDQQAALYGQGCWRPGQAKNTYGTGCFLLMNMGTTRPQSQHGLLTTLCCAADGSPVYGLEGSVFIAGAAIQWLRDALGIISTAAETEAIAQRLDDNGGVYMVPAFAGLGAPYWDMDARGTLVGLTRGTGRDHIVRAALESIAYQTRDVVAAMEADSGIAATELRVDGGATVNGFLMQFQADILGIPVDRPRVMETTVLGSAYLAGLATGFWSTPEEVAADRSAQRFEPTMETDDAERLYRGWQDAVGRTATGPRGDSR